MMVSRFGISYDPPATFVVRGAELRLTVRVGVALFPSDASSADELVRNAEAAPGAARTAADRLLHSNAAMTPGRPAPSSSSVPTSPRRVSG